MFDLCALFRVVRSAVLNALGSRFRFFTSTQPPPLPPLPLNILCPICLDPAPPFESQAASTLSCGHTLCRDCAVEYVTIKVRERHVGSDQLICPIIECKRPLIDSDLHALLTTDGYALYKRVQDEKNPRARWCVRPQCGELILCAPGAKVFTCPKCSASGCFRCCGSPHLLWFLCWLQTKDTIVDASFSRWEKSVGDGRAVRACPECKMRIWKSGGCNHMVCTRCRYQYCWVCDAKWRGRHYACRDPPPHNEITAMDRILARFHDWLKSLCAEVAELFYMAVAVCVCVVIVSIALLIVSVRFLLEQVNSAVGVVHSWLNVRAK